MSPESVNGVTFRGFLEGSCPFLGSVVVEIDRFEPLQHRWRSSKLPVLWAFLGFMLLLLLLLLSMVLLGVQARSNGNGANHEVEEDEENSGCEPAIHGSPD